MSAPVALIAAVARNGVIGRDGRLPWRIPADMRRFKALTMGKPCVMGRKTWDSLPRRPLPGRLNIVVTRDPAFAAPGAVVIHAVDEALARARAENPDEVMVIGGEAIYAAALPHATHLRITELAADYAGDARFPDFNREEWVETAREGPFSEDGLVYSFVTFERQTPNLPPSAR